MHKQLGKIGLKTWPWCKRAEKLGEHMAMCKKVLKECRKSLYWNDLYYTEKTKCKKKNKKKQKKPKCKILYIASIDILL